MRHGKLNVATCVIVNGRSGVGFCAPALTCAPAVVDMNVRNSAALARSFIGFPIEFSDVTKVTTLMRHYASSVWSCRRGR
jgi:hypothetical protein